MGTQAMITKETGVPRPRDTGHIDEHHDVTKGTNPGGQITISAAEYRALRVAAESWWRLWVEAGKPGGLNDLIDAEVLRRIRGVSIDVSGAARWSNIGPTYRELERRRRITSVLSCGVCGEPVEVVHPIERWQFERLPNTSWVRCADHREVAA